MAKRFTDSLKYRKGFFRGLPGPYKLLWDMLYHECDHAGVWHVDFEIAQILVGKDMPVDQARALKLFNEGEERVRAVDDGKRWVVLPFIDFQYGLPLNPANKVHDSVLKALSRYKIKALTSPVTSPSQGAKDKEREKAKEVLPPKEEGLGETITFDEAWQIYPKKKSKGQAERAWEKLNPPAEQGRVILDAITRAKTSTDWKRDGGKYIPHFATWIRAKGWEDEVTVPPPGVDDIILGYKDLLGVPDDDAVWDREIAPHHLAAAQSMLNMFSGDVDETLGCMERVHAYLTQKRKLENVTLQLIVNNSTMERNAWLERQEKLRRTA